MAARFEIDVLTKFRSVGLNQVAQEARTALAQVANTPGLSSAQRVTRASQVRVEAERAIATQAAGQLATVRASGLTGNQLAAAEAAVKKEASQARRAVTRLFDEVTKETTDLGKRLARAVRNAGTPILTAAQARGAVDLTPVPLTDAESRAADRAAKARARAESEQILANNPAYYADRQTARRAASEREARVAQQAAADQEYLRNTAAAARAKKEEADRIQAMSLGIRGAGTAPISEVRVAAALQQKVNADLQAASVARARAAQERNATSTLARASAARRAAERELTAAIHLNAKQEVRQAIAAGEGTRFQRLQARFQAGGSARLPSEFQGAGQFIGSRALTTIGYGLAGTALYGGARAIGEMVREAEELDRVLNQVEAQLEAVGSPDQYEGARQGILRIARETGAAADEVAAVQFQFQGAFGALEDGSIDAQRALVETEAAMKVVAVTGLSIKEVLDSLTATARTFGVGIEEIGDHALGVQERFGVMATETITFVADLAPVAQQIGLSLEDLASLGGVAQQVSGKSGAALAEGFGRIFPQLQELRSEILEIYDLPNLQQYRGDILEGFATGDTGAVFQRLVRDFDSLSKAQQAFVIDMLGGRREAQVLIPVLQNASLLTRDWDRNLAGLNDTTGKTDDYFSRLQTTVQLAGKRFGEAVRQIGEGLFRAGAADAFVAIANAASTVAGVIVTLVNVFGAFNRMLDGAPVRILAYAAAFRILRAIAGVTARSIQSKTAATVQETQAAATSAIANQQEARAFQQVSAAATISARAVTADTIADNANAASSARARQQNSAQGLPYATQQGAYRTQPPIPIGSGALPYAGTQYNSAAGLPYATPGRFPSLGNLRNNRLMNFGRSYSGFIGLTIAMEGLNQFFQNSAEEVQKLDELRADIAEKFAENEDIEQTIADLEARAASLRGQNLNEGIQGAGALGSVVNFIGGKARSILGIGSDAENDAILRSAAGKPQDYTVIEEEVAKQRAQQYSDVITSVFAADRGAEQLIEALQSADIGALNEAIENNLSFATDPVLLAFTGTTNLRSSQIANDAVDGLIDKRDITEENIRILIEAAAEGDQVAAEMLRLLRDYIESQPDLARLLSEGTKNEVEDAAREAAGGEGNYQLQNLETAKQQFEAGSISLGAYVKEAQQTRKNIADAILASRSAGEEPLIADIIALAESDNELAEIAGDAAQSRIDALGSLVDLLSGGENQRASTAALDQQIALVEQFITSNTGTQEQQFAQIPELIGLLRERFERDLEGIADEAERARVEARGFKIPQALQSLFVEQQLVNDPVISAMLGRYAELAGLSLDAVTTMAANALINSEKSIIEITREMIQAKINQLLAVIDRLSSLGVATDLAGVNAAIAALQGELDALPDESEITAPVEVGDTGYAGGTADSQKDAEEEARRAARARAEAQLEVRRARAAGDPEALARLDLEAAEIARKYADDDAESLQAEAARIEAWNSVREAQEDIGRARLELYAAQVQRDPVRSAQAQISLAYLAIAQARGTADRIRAQIEMVNAQQALVQAQQEVTYAWLEGVQAYFDVIGDSVRAAEIGLQLAQKKFADILADSGAGEAERTQARTAAKIAEETLRRAKFDDQIGDIDYLLEMEEISVQQAIRMLEAMARVPGATEEMIRTIERRIKSLSEELSRDYQFNLPSDIAPTLYEVRRLNRRTADGAAYNTGVLPSSNFLSQADRLTAAASVVDNRQITIEFNANNVTEAQEIAEYLVEQFSRPTRFGTTPRMF